MTTSARAVPRAQQETEARPGSSASPLVPQRQQVAVSVPSGAPAARRHGIIIRMG
ncbi:hypothetical protein [Microbacterium sp. MYb66]|jgi:hypothetical protein|uniref:hypothetical protein n=1 Tax=Microbacterium sp. MYb66 TaxID=1848692 RepID=UPI0015E41EFC|nr:hypothetical protein [Microbacterium sp. MYb66]